MFDWDPRLCYVLLKNCFCIAHTSSYIMLTALLSKHVWRPMGRERVSGLRLMAVLSLVYTTLMISLITQLVESSDRWLWQKLTSHCHSVFQKHILGIDTNFCYARHNSFTKSTDSKTRSIQTLRYQFNIYNSHLRFPWLEFCVSSWKF